MAELSLRECYDSQLANVPIVDGQIIFVSDTGKIYKDDVNNRVEYCKSVIIVDELPVAPIANQLYLDKSNYGLYVHNGNSFIKLNVSAAEYSSTVKELQALQKKVSTLDAMVKALAEVITPPTT